MNKGVMTQESEVSEKKTYTFRNEDSSARAVIVEHPVRLGYELRSQLLPVEITAGWMRFRVQVEPKQTVSLVIEEARPSAATFALSNVTSDQVGVFVRERSIGKTVEDALRKIVTQKGALDELIDETSACEEEKEKNFDDQRRLRENMKALKGSAEEKSLLQRYTKQLDEQENRLEALEKETKQIQAKRDSAQSVLDRMIAELSLDVRFKN
jgi:hypothetical protein